MSCNISFKIEFLALQRLRKIKNIITKKSGQGNSVVIIKKKQII